MSSMSGGERINLAIVIGLLLLAIGCLVDVHFMAAESKETGQLTGLVNTIASGLIGYLGRELKQMLSVGNVGNAINTPGGEGGEE